MAKSVGILTGGGDCPGLNAVIRAVVRRADAAGWQAVGVREGWRGLVEPIFEDLGPAQVSGILPRGGTIVGTSRTNPFKLEGAVERVLQNFRDRELDALVAIGGEDTLGVAARLYAEHQLPVVGVPKTIDNDLSGTDYTFGFDTAVSVATEAIDRLHTTAESHNRVMVVEVMGRHTGWIAVMSGIAGGADVILVPEIPVDFEEVAESIRKRHARGKNFSIVVVSEGCELPGLADAEERDQFGHVTLSKRGVGDALGQEIEQRTGYETRVTVLGHIQRGGSPTSRDRVLATRFGLKAADLALAGEFGLMAALHGDDVVAVPLAEATAELKRVPPEWMDVARAFFG
ncbi:MAG TPA: ATP-dependent 6-phosphofructokinase [Gaiellaceae bacterium]|jgi:6-phosphofructokinase 1|nr:ATP-dependent 6-phosphofructokinase [Gaiellaceae bacterium]